MKIVLDLTQLVAEGRLTEAQSQELQALARPATGLLAINILMAFGVFAIAGGVMLLLPTVATAIALGVVLAGAGVAIALGVGPQWSLLGTAVTIEGALITSAGIIAMVRATRRAAAEHYPRWGDRRRDCDWAVALQLAVATRCRGMTVQ